MSTTSAVTYTTTNTDTFAGPAGYTVVRSSTGSHVPCHTSSNSSVGSSVASSSGDFLKKVGNNILEALTNLVSGNATVCVNCQQKPAKVKCNTPYCCGEKFCSPECHLEAYDRYQQFKSGKRKCKFQGCNKLCYVENDGKVHEFCTKSHAKEYQAQQWELKQKQQYLKLQHQHHQKQQKQKPADEKLYKLPGYKKPCSSQAYELCGKTHSNLYKAHHNQVGKQQKGPPQPPTGPIYFYNRDEEYYEFTNFAPYHVTIDYKDWPTTEHYFQAQKFVNTPYEEAIRLLSFPREAFDFSRKPEVSRWCRSDWEQVKEDIMHKALLAKFTQHEWLCRRLLSTGDRTLVEHTKNDSYWGDGGDGTGKNRLGSLLMAVRKTLRQPPKVTSLPPPKPMPVIYQETLLSNLAPQDYKGHKPHDDKGHEPMDTSTPLSPKEPLTNTHSTVDNMVVIQNFSAVSTQDAGDTLEEDMGTFQATNETGSNMMNGSNSGTAV